MSADNPPPKPATTRQTLDGLIRRSRSMERGVPPAVKQGLANISVVAIKGLSSSAKTEDLCEDKLLSGDIVQEVNVGGVSLVAPFAGGKTGLQRELRQLYGTGDTLVQVKVRRARGKTAEVGASIVPDESVMLRRNYALRALNDPSHIVTLVDSTEEECLALQEMRCARLLNQLANTPLKDVYRQYSWEEKIQQVLPAQRSNMVFSFLVVPFSPDRAVPSYNDLDDTVVRAMSWLSASQTSGVPINFLNIQTEPILTKVPGQQASSCTVSQEDLSSIINTGIYGFEDYHGIDIGVVRAVRLWYVPTVGEITIVLNPEEGETRLGVGISRTDEGFCYVSSVENGTVADKAGLKTLYQEARSAGIKLVISRVGEEKITPSMVSSSGSIRCFDTLSISHKLVLHRQAGQPVKIQLMVWDGAMLARESCAAEVHENRMTTIKSHDNKITTNHCINTSEKRNQRHFSDPFENYLRSPCDLCSEKHEIDDTSFEFDKVPSAAIDRDSTGEFSFRLSNFDIPTCHFEKYW